MLGQTTATQDSQDSPRLGLKGSHHLPPYSILCASPWHLHPNDFLSRDSKGGVSKLSRFRLPPLRKVILFVHTSDWDEVYCSFHRELSNGVSHSTCMHQSRVDSRLLVVGSQIANLTFGLSFCHNLCCKCPNDSCEPIFGIYVSIAFQ